MSAQLDPASKLWPAPPPAEAAAHPPTEIAPERTAALLDGVLDAMGGPAIVLDAGGRIERINRSAASQTGLHAGDAFLEKLVGPRELRLAMDADIAHGMPLAFYTSPGIEWRSFPIRDRGALVGTALFADM